MLYLSGILNTTPSGSPPAGTPTFQAAGTAVEGTSSPSFAWPTHLTDDLGILLMEGNANETAMSSPAGWTEIGNWTSGGNSTHTRLYAWYKVATSASEANCAPTFSGDHFVGQIVTIRGASTIAQLGAASTLAFGTALSVTSGTTGGANRLILVASANHRDISSDQITSWTNANLTSVTDRGGGQTSLGGGGGFDLMTGEMATAGAVGSSTATYPANANAVAVTLEIAP